MATNEQTTYVLYYETNETLNLLDVCYVRAFTTTAPTIVFDLAKCPVPQGETAQVGITLLETTAKAIRELGGITISFADWQKSQVEESAREERRGGGQ